MYHSSQMVMQADSQPKEESKQGTKQNVEQQTKELTCMTFSNENISDSGH